MRYNDESSAAHKNAIRMANFFKTRFMSKLNTTSVKYLLTGNKDPRMPLSWAKGGGRKKAIVDKSDDEYQEELQREEESEEEPVLRRTRRSTGNSDDDEDFIVDDDDYD